jgi:hypothetical protein
MGGLGGATGGETSGSATGRSGTLGASRKTKIRLFEMSWRSRDTVTSRAKARMETTSIPERAARSASGPARRIAAVSERASRSTR